MLIQNVENQIITIIYLSKFIIEDLQEEIFLEKDVYSDRFIISKLLAKICPNLWK